MTYQPIKCTDYDNYELMCIQKAQVKITLIDGQLLAGNAVDLKNIRGEGEFLKLKLANQKGEQLVRLDQIRAISYF